MDANESNAPGNRTRRRRPWQDPSSPSPEQNLASSPGTTAERRCVGNNSATASLPTVLPIAQRLLSMPELNSNNSKLAPPQKCHQRRDAIWAATLLCIVSLPSIFYLRKNAQATNYNQSYYATSSGRSLHIPYLMHHQGDDVGEGNVGGWLVSSGRRKLPAILEEPNSGLADYGGLVFLSLQQQILEERSIRPNDSLLYNAEKDSQLESMNGESISKRHWFNDELEDLDQECRRPSWEMSHFPTCRAFHEIDLSRNYDAQLAQRSGDVQAGDSFYLSHGYFRDVFALNRNQQHAKAVLKVARYTKHEMNYRPLWNARRDALIMERLTGSPNIVDIYGHCGSSVMVESLPHEVEEKIVPGGGWMKHEDLEDSEDVDIQNNFTVPEKLAIALEMAESIAELHGYKDGVIVHDDIQLCQWLRNDEGKLKLGDFNRARVLAWNDKAQKYCKYENGRGYGNYRSPEEYGEKPLLQTHDVWSFGNNLYALLSGLWIFYDNEDDEVVSGKIVNGTTAFIDKRYRTRSYVEGRLVELMEKCWVYDMKKRATIFEVVDFLRKTVKENERRRIQGKR